MIYFEDKHIKLYQSDVLDGLTLLEDNSIQCVITSPPYWGLRDYGVEGQLGLEKTPEEYVANMVAVFREIRRVLKKDGTLWMNLGDSYASGGNSGPSTRGKGNFEPSGKHGYLNNKVSLPGVPDDLKPKDLIGIPWRVALALQADGWYLRSDIIWSKPNPMPESVTDRPTKAHEYLFLLTKSERYYYDHEAIKEKAMEEHLGRYKYKFTGSKKGQKEAMPLGYTIHPEGMRGANGFRNKRSVWEVPTKSYAEAHFATFPPKLIEPCILAGSRPGDTVLDPFWGSGTTGQVAVAYQRKAIGIEINPEYCEISLGRFKQGTLDFIGGGE